MTSSRIDESLAAIVTAVDVTTQRQGTSTRRSARLAYDNALACLEVAEFWMRKAATRDAAHTPPPIYDDQGRREELKPKPDWDVAQPSEQETP